MGKHASSDKSYAFDIAEQGTRYRFFGWNTLLSDDGTHIQNLRAVLYDRRCNLLPDYPLIPVGLTHDPERTGTLIGITLTWTSWADRVEEIDGKGAEPDYYTLSYKPKGSGAWTEAPDKITSNEFVFGANGQFKPGSEWLFAIKAVVVDPEDNSLYHSGYSKGTECAFANMPDAPTNVKMIADIETGVPDTSYVKFTWTESKYNGGSKILYYLVEIKDAQGTYHGQDASKQFYCTATEVVSSCSVKYSKLNTAPLNIQWGSVVEARVSAVNLAGPSKTQALSSGTDTLKVAPNAVQSIVQQLPRSKYDMTVEWAPLSTLAERGGYDEVTYSLYMSTGDANSFELVESGIVENSYMVRTVELGTTYTFRVEAVAALGLNSPYLESDPILHFSKPDSPIVMIMNVNADI